MVREVQQACPHPNDVTRPRAVICDDLSGACEVAGVLHQAGHRTVVSLGEPAVDAALNVVDLALRERSGDDARRSTAAALERCDVAFVKVDSMLRGPIGAIIEGCRADPRQVLFCSALPAAGRTIVDGVPMLNGRRLGASDAWQLEAQRAPATIGEVLAPSSGTTGRGVLCADASTDADLDVAACLARRHGLLPVGAAGLLAALVRDRWFGDSDEDPGHAAAEVRPARSGHGVMVVVGTASTNTDDQIDALERDGALALRLDPTEPPRSLPDVASRTLEHGGTVVVHWRRSAGLDPRRSDALTAAMAELVAGVVEGAPHVPLVLTGGRTARSVLERLGTTTLRPAAVVHHGAVVAIADDGRRVTVRPGSFGDRWSLVQLSSAVA